MVVVMVMVVMMMCWWWYSNNLMQDEELIGEQARRASHSQVCSIENCYNINFSTYVTFAL